MFFFFFFLRLCDGGFAVLFPFCCRFHSGLFSVVLVL